MVAEFNKMIERHAPRCFSTNPPEAQMSRDEVLNVLRAHKAMLSQRFGDTDLVLFGSVACDQA